MHNKQFIKITFHLAGQTGDSFALMSAYKNYATLIIFVDGVNTNRTHKLSPPWCIIDSRHCLDMV